MSVTAFYISQQRFTSPSSASWQNPASFTVSTHLPRSLNSPPPLLSPQTLCPFTATPQIQQIQEIISGYIHTNENAVLKRKQSPSLQAFEHRFRNNLCPYWHVWEAHSTWPPLSFPHSPTLTQIKTYLEKTKTLHTVTKKCFYLQQPPTDREDTPILQAATRIL